MLMVRENFRRVRGAAPLVPILCMLLSSAANAQAINDPNPNAIPLMEKRLGPSPQFKGESAAIIYNIATQTTSTTALGDDDVELKTHNPQYSNPVQIERPIVPADPSFPLIQFDGALSCSATAIGRRAFLTAGHCVFDIESGKFRKSAIVYPGYPQAQKIRLEASQFVAFTGYTVGHDYAHDVALVVTKEELPPNTKLFTIGGDKPDCASIRLAFDRQYYQGGFPNQLFIQGMHNACEENQLTWAIGTTRGSSGSGAVMTGTNLVYGVYSNSTTSGPGHTHGHDAWISIAKACFIKSNFLGQSCAPPDNEQPTVLILESARIETLNTAQTVSIPVYRTGAAKGRASLRYATVSVTAKAGIDFEDVTGQLLWEDGDKEPKVVRVRLLGPDPGCNRYFLIDFSRSQQGDPPGAIKGPMETQVSIVSATTNPMYRRMLLQQFVAESVTSPTLPAKYVLQSSDGEALYVNDGYVFSAFWRNRARGVIVFEKHYAQANASVAPPVISSDGHYIARLTEYSDLEVLTRGINTTAIVKSSSLGYDADRNLARVIASSPEFPGHVYVVGYNPNSKTRTILRYKRNALSGALEEKETVAGFGRAIRVSRDGGWLFSLTDDGIWSYKRSGDGRLQKLSEANRVFGSWIPKLIASSSDGRLLFVSANNGIYSKLLTFAVSENGTISLRSDGDGMLTSIQDVALSADGSKLFALGVSNNDRFSVLQFAVDAMGNLKQTGDYDPHRCGYDSQMAFYAESFSLDEDSRFLTIGANQKAMIVLRLDDAK